MCVHAYGRHFNLHAVPAVYPRNVYNQLRMVDTLEKMGISPSFSYEINNILDTTYRSVVSLWWNPNLLIDDAWALFCLIHYLLLIINLHACSSWLAKDDEIMLDMATCAMAFRLLRMHGYDVSSGNFSWFYFMFEPPDMTSGIDRTQAWKC